MAIATVNPSSGEVLKKFEPFSAAEVDAARAVHLLEEHDRHRRRPGGSQDLLGTGDALASAGHDVDADLVAGQFLAVALLVVDHDQHGVTDDYRLLGHDLPLSDTGRQSLIRGSATVCRMSTTVLITT